MEGFRTSKYNVMQRNIFHNKYTFHQKEMKNIHVNGGRTFVRISLRRREY